MSLQKRFLRFYFFGFDLIIFFLLIKPSVLADKLATLHFIILLILLKLSLLSKDFFFNYCLFQFSPAFLP